MGGEKGENADEQLMRLTREEVEWKSEGWDRGRLASEEDHWEREEARRHWEMGGWDKYDWRLHRNVVREDGSKEEVWNTIDGGGWEHEIDPGRMEKKWRIKENEEGGGEGNKEEIGGIQLRRKVGSVPTPKRKARDLDSAARIMGEEGGSLEARGPLGEEEACGGVELGC